MPKPAATSGRTEAIYLCGNSLGAMPVKAREYVDAELDKWGTFGALMSVSNDTPNQINHYYLSHKAVSIAFFKRGGGPFRGTPPVGVNRRVRA
jgi:hypothetical protein